MARGLFVTGFTVSEVLAIQQKAKEFLLEGKTVEPKRAKSAGLIDEVIRTRSTPELP